MIYLRFLGKEKWDGIILILKTKNENKKNTMISL